MITLTERSIDKVREIQQPKACGGQALRVRVIGGGCSGFSYDLFFDDEYNADIDENFECGRAFRCIVDMMSLTLPGRDRRSTTSKACTAPASSSTTRPRSRPAAAGRASRSRGPRPTLRPSRASKRPPHRCQVRALSAWSQVARCGGCPRRGRLVCRQVRVP